MNNPRIYADFNGAIYSEMNNKISAIPLTKYGSLRDLCNLGIRLRNGLKIVVYMDSDENEEIEADAEVIFSKSDNCWLAHIKSEIRDVPKSLQNFKTFRCSKYQFELYDIVKDGLKLGDACPICNTRIHSVFDSEYD